MSWKFACGLLFAFACVSVANADDAEDAAAKWVESTGGKATRDAKADGKPVVEVFFGSTMKVTNDGLKELAGLKKLKSLTIFFCEQITDDGAKHLKGLTTLEKLSLTNTGVGDAGVAELKGLKSLKELHAAGSIRMTDKATETIGEFADLERLTLPSTITEKGVKNLAGLKKLKMLYVGGANLTDAAIKDIADGMPDLESLELGAGLGSSITDASVPHLTKLKKLKQLGLWGSKITDDGLKALQQALPGCKITPPKDKK